jgi:hypothetical protein
MRKSSKLIVVGGALAALAIPSVASADVQRGEDIVTAATPKTVTFHATQPSGGGGNWNHTFTVDVDGTGHFTGKNVIVGLDAGKTVTVDETVSGTLTDTDSNGYADHVSLSAVRDSGFYTFKWSVSNAPMDGVENDMDRGTTSFVTAENWQGGPLPITFTAPTEPLFNTDPEYKNHGQYVKSQGGGKDAAQSSIGMPEQSQKNKK